MQENFYKYCGVDPIQFWRYTPAETTMMITAAIDNLTFEYDFRNRLEARLCAIVLTANGVMKSGRTPYDTKDFMPKKAEAPKTAEQLEQMAIAAVTKLGGEVSYY
jgi:hypothetical protein